MYRKVVSILTLGLSLFSFSLQANSFNCEIENISTGASAPKLIYVTMACKSSNPIQSGTYNCTAAAISDDTVAFDATTEQGKIYLPMLMTAMISKKRTLISMWGNCFVESPSVPILYSIKVFN
ncbi:MAG: hypothetical protein MJK04_15595 [Psychrosphaera sp.]|nr:hypothetical protein [Psychrosphaera sp.]